MSSSSLQREATVWARHLDEVRRAERHAPALELNTRGLSARQVERLEALQEEARGLRDDIADMEAELEVLLVKQQAKRQELEVESQRTINAKLASKSLKALHDALLNDHLDTATTTKTEDGIREVDVAQLRTDVQLTERLTGIHFSLHQNHLLPSGNERQYHLVGTCRQVPFTLSFVVSEPEFQVKSAQASFRHTAGSDVDPEDDYYSRVLEPVRSRLHSSLDVRRFFSDLHAVCDIFDQRTEVWEWMAEEFRPDLLRFPLGTRHSPVVHVASDSTSFRFDLQWAVAFEPEVHPRLVFMPRVNGQTLVRSGVLSAQGDAPLDDPAAEFLNLVRVQGIKSALQLMVDLVQGNVRPIAQGHDEEDDEDEG